MDLGPAGWVISDDTWEARKIDAWSDEWRRGDGQPIISGIPMEVIGARHLPRDWQAVNFDDSEWGYAQVVRSTHIGSFAQSQPPTDPYGPLYPRPIAKLTGETRMPTRVDGAVLAGEVDRTIPNLFSRVTQTLRLPVVASLPSTTLPPHAGTRFRPSGPVAN